MHGLILLYGNVDICFLISSEKSYERELGTTLNAKTWFDGEYRVDSGGEVKICCTEKRG